MSKEPFVVILIPNYNSASIKYKNKPILFSCLDSLGKTNYKNYKIVIADNSSTDDSEKVVGRFSKVDFVVKNTKEEYGGIPRTNNFGIKYAIKRYNPDYILMFNTDMLIKDRNWLKKLVEVAESDMKIGLVSCKLTYPTGRIQHAGMIIDAAPRNRGRAELDVGQYDKIEEMSGATAALLLIRKNVIKKVGLFDENFYNGFDDTDFCIRVKKAGFKIVYNGKASVIHFEGFASANAPNRSVRDRSFYGYQVSYIYFAFKDLKALDRTKAILIELSRSIISIEDNERIRKVTNIKFRDRKLWRLKVSINAIFAGHRIYVRNKRGIR